MRKPSTRTGELNAEVNSTVYDLFSIGFRISFEELGTVNLSKIYICSLCSFSFSTDRYSDTSQYDNVPIRMRGTSPNYKKGRDVSFNVPSPPKGYGKAYNKIKDEMEMLEECFGSLRTAGTQTAGTRTPSSPTDPGYVRHTASNWPQETKIRTPGGSPVHVKN